MLKSSPSPRLDASASNERRHIRRSLKHNDSASRMGKGTSPIVKPHTAHVFSDQRSSYHRHSTSLDSAPGTSPKSLKNGARPQSIHSNVNTRTNTATDQGTQTVESSFQPSTTTSSSSTTTTADAGTQYSPPDLRPPLAPNDLSSTASSTTSSRTPPASHIARLEIHEPQDSSSQAFTAQEQQINPGTSRVLSSLNAAMPPAPSGTTTSKTTLKNHSVTAVEEKEIPKEPPLGPASPSSTTSTSKRHLPNATDAKSKENENGSSDSTQSKDGEDEAGRSKRQRAEDPAVKVMPILYETCDTRDLVILISSMLMELIRYNDGIPLRDGHLTRFHSRAPPGISVIDYLQRLTTHATLSPPIMLSMVYYIDKLCALYPAFTISSLTVHRFLITAATVASKGLSDSFWTNKTYAKVGGVSLRELALLEMEFLVRVQWRIVPQPEVLVDYYRSLVERTPGYTLEGAKENTERS